MIRSLPPSEPELLSLCRKKTWLSVSNRIKSHPIEAHPNDAAIRGEGSTSLSLALRLGAPLKIIQQLLTASLDQIGVTHSSRGTVLHEALKHRANNVVLECLVKAAIDYDSQLFNSKNRRPHLFSRKDELGRTVLHYMVDRIVRMLDRGEKINKIWTLFRMLVLEYPSSVETVDDDGNTPLIMLLLIPKVISSSGEIEIENEVQLMLELCLKICPRAATIARRMPLLLRHYRFKRESQSSLLHGDGVPSPLSCSLLHGRSMKTINLLLNASRSIGVNSCRTVVTHHREIPLHIAATMRVPIALLSRLIQEDNAVIGVTDIHGLTPLDWIWIRHVVDWCSLTNPFDTIAVSRRRYLTNHFMDWYNKVSNQYLGIDRPMVGDLARRLRQDIVNRISILLPRMAMQHLVVNEMLWDESDVLPLLHSACAISCPLAMLELVCERSPQDLRAKDKKLNRLPLHYAASRGGYARNFPIGVSCNLQYAEEISPINVIMPKFPDACRVVDIRWQLPLHIAIENAKRDTSGDADFSIKKVERPAESYDEIEVLLKQYPEGLQRRDGVTKIYPFMQAAEGMESNLSLTFLLLRLDPSLLAN